jgi:hypothetical protein
MDLHQLHSERPAWVSAFRAGALLMAIGVPLVIAHLLALALTSHGQLPLLEMLTAIATPDGIDRLYLTGLAMAGSGACVMAGAALEGWLGRVFPMN